MNRAALEERRAQAVNDLISVERQLEAGELDEESAARLRSLYYQEATAAAEALEALDEEFDDDPGAEAEPDPFSSPAPLMDRASLLPKQSRTRVMIGAAVIAVALAAIGIAVVNSVQDRGEGELLTGGTAAPQQDLSQVPTEELEQVVADFPDVVPMRLALARRYFLADDYQAAFPHYMQILDQEPENPEALANLGWMVYVSGEPATGAALLNRALTAQPDYAQATLYLAVVRMRGLNDPDGALRLLDELVATGEVPDDLLPQIDELRAEARGN